MIGMIQLAAVLEEEINKSLKDEDFAIKIWANVGRVTPAIRTGNNVKYHIDASLISSSSSNEDNILQMGINNLMLDFVVPTKPFKTNAKQTSSELDAIHNNQYDFINHVKQKIDKVFEKSFVLYDVVDAEGTFFTISVKSGLSATGIADIRNHYDESVEFSVSLAVTFLEGGINAREFELYLDGERLPLMNLSTARRGQNQPDVFSDGNQIVKNLNTASSISFNINIPLTKNKLYNVILDNIYNGKINIAHFVTLKIKEKQYHYLMLLQDPSISAQGVYFAGITASLIECYNNPYMIDFNQDYEIGMFIFDRLPTRASELAVYTNLDLLYVGNTFFKKIDPQGIAIKISPNSSFIYDESRKKYILMCYSLGKSNIQLGSVLSVKYEIIREAKDG